MNWQDFIDLLEEEEKKATESLIQNYPESSVHIYRKLKLRIKTMLKKEADHGLAER